ncbi:unnamed protein product, partial [Rotaria magnacalcarata]
IEVKWSIVSAIDAWMHFSFRTCFVKHNVQYQTNNIRRNCTWERTMKIDF